MAEIVLGDFTGTIDSLNGGGFAQEEQRVVSFHDTDPLSVMPHGDRLLVEILFVDETTKSGIELVRQNEKDKEHDLGWSAGVVINVGSGHRLDTPDQAVVIKTTEKGLNDSIGLVAVDPDTGDGVIMAQSKVPMPFKRGMVVLLAKYAGSELKLRDKTYRIITQAHVIAVLTGVKMRVGPDEGEAEEMNDDVG